MQICCACEIVLPSENLLQNQSHLFGRMQWWRHYGFHNNVAETDTFDCTRRGKSDFECGHYVCLNTLTLDYHVKRRLEGTGQILVSVSFKSALMSPGFFSVAGAACIIHFALITIDIRFVRLIHSACHLPE